MKLINKYQSGGKTFKEKLVSKSQENKKMKKDLSKMKDHEKYQDFMQQLNNWIAKNPKISLMSREIPSVYLKTLIPELAYLESDFNQNATNQFGFKGYFQLSKDYFKGWDFDSQMKGFINHTNDKLKTLTSKDLERAYAHGYSDQQIIAKLHNQGFHLQDYLLNGKERYDGNEVPISEYGNQVSGNSRLLKYLINQEEYNESNPPILKEGESSGTYAPYIRQVELTPGILNYFDTNKVDSIQQPGDTIFLNKYQKGGMLYPDWYKELVSKYGDEWKRWKKENPNGDVREFARSKGYVKPIKKLNNMLDRSNVPGMTPYNSQTNIYKKIEPVYVEDLPEKVEKKYKCIMTPLVDWTFLIV